MDPHSGRLYASREEAIADGVDDAVEVVGDPGAVREMSFAISEYARAKAAGEKERARRRKRIKAANKARRVNRGS